MTDWKEITDPEELFRLRREGWEIEYRHMAKEYWQPWNNTWWQEDSEFRARPRQPKVVTKKLCAWANMGTGQMLYTLEEHYMPTRWIRQPHLDLEGRFPE